VEGHVDGRIELDELRIGAAERPAGRVEEFDADLAAEPFFRGPGEPDGEVERLVLEGGKHLRRELRPTGLRRRLPEERRGDESGEEQHDGPEPPAKRGRLRHEKPPRYLQRRSTSM